MSKIIEKLITGDMRTTGKSDEVAEIVLKNPELFSELFSALSIDDAGIRMRAADAIARVSHKNAQFVQPYKDNLINEVSKINQQEVQWHFAEIISLIELDKNEQEKVVEILINNIKTTKSNIVKVFSLQALADIAKVNEQYKNLTIKLITEEMKSGKPSIVSRGKKLLKQLGVNN